MLYVAFLTPPCYKSAISFLEYENTTQTGERCIQELTLVAKHPHKRIYHCIIYFCRINDTVFSLGTYTFFSPALYSQFYKRRKMGQCVLVQRNIRILKLKSFLVYVVYTSVHRRDVIKLFNSFIHMGIMYNCTILSPENEHCVTFP